MGCEDNVPPLLNRGRDRLFNQDMNAIRDAGQRDLMMKVGRRSDGNGIHACRDQLLEARKGAAIRQVRCARPVCRQRIDDPDQSDSGQPGQHAGMITAHHASADHADAKRAFLLCPPETHIAQAQSCFAADIPAALVARRHRRGEYVETIPDTF